MKEVDGNQSICAVYKFFFKCLSVSAFIERSVGTTGRFFYILHRFCAAYHNLKRKHLLGIVVIDFGGQYAHLIANRIRRLRVYAEIRSPIVDVSELAEADGIILSGGPASVYDENAPAFNKEILHTGKPLLGLCYGHQMICQEFGGCVEPGDVVSLGPHTLTCTSRKSSLMDWLSASWSG